MDMQNVKELEITEGYVRTIHDKDGNFLWGRVAYDTKYSGDTIQDGTPTPDAPVDVQVVTGGQTVTVTGKNLFDKSAITTGRYIAQNGSIASSNSWCISDYISVVGGAYYTYQGLTVAGIAPYSAYYDGSKTFISSFKQAVGTHTITPPNGARYVRFSIAHDQNNQDTFQIETGSTATTYEAYKGTTYTVNLGSIELCKIGTYQDYIYKSGDDWYLHKATGRCDFSSSTPFVRAGTKSFLLGYTATSPFYGLLALGDPSYQSFCNTFTFQRNGTTWAGAGKCGFNSGGAFWIMHTQNIDSVPDLQTWLDSNPTFVYYPLAATTETQIVDSTLISQLNAIHEWLTRYGYNATVSGNLPIIIDRTAL